MKLSRTEMKNVLGGLCDPNNPDCAGGGGGAELCRFRYVSASGVSSGTTNSVVLLGGSAEANQKCIAYVQANAGTHCHYDCDGDGWAV